MTKEEALALIEELYWDIDSYHEMRYEHCTSTSSSTYQRLDDERESQLNQINQLTKFIEENVR